MNWASESRPVIVGLGELLWDVFPDGRRPGGAPANVAFHASQLGCEGVVVSRVGQDPLGEEILAYLAQQGLSTRWIQRDQQHPTGTVTVQLNRNGHPQYIIHENVAWDYLEMEPGLEELMRKASAVCFGTLAQRSHSTRRTIQKALAATPKECLIVYDVNLRRPFVKRDWVEESLVGCHIVKLTMEELHELADLLAIGLSDPVPFARVLQDHFGVETVCLTQGRQGCLLIDPDGVLSVPGVPAKVVDPVGAGDAFTAALIYSRLRGWSREKGAAFATRCGALVVERPGAMPPLREEFAALAAQFDSPT